MDQALKMPGFCIFAWIPSLINAGILYFDFQALLMLGLYTLHVPGLTNAGPSLTNADSLAFGF
jgi:hypothetical protein